jgi:hypothetical protein
VRPARVEVMVSRAADAGELLAAEFDDGEPPADEQADATEARLTARRQVARPEITRRPRSPI